VLDPDVLTIGFARRFATYKRATLLLRDPDRLARILNDPARPVQVIYSGKAHPRDDAGKAFIPAHCLAGPASPSSAAVWSSWKSTTWRSRVTWSRA